MKETEGKEEETRREKKIKESSLDLGLRTNENLTPLVIKGIWCILCKPQGYLVHFVKPQEYLVHFVKPREYLLKKPFFLRWSHTILTTLRIIS